MKKILMTLAILAVGAFMTPAMADKGGEPNESANENAGGSANAHGENPNAGKGHDNDSPGHTDGDGGEDDGAPPPDADTAATP